MLELVGGLLTCAVADQLGLVSYDGVERRDEGVLYCFLIQMRSGAAAGAFESILIGKLFAARLFNTNQILLLFAALCPLFAVPIAENSKGLPHSFQFLRRGMVQQFKQFVKPAVGRRL